MRVSSWQALVILGLMWIGSGIFLFTKGFWLLAALLALPALGSEYFVSISSYFGGGQRCLLFMICLSLFVGWIKARFIFFPVVKKITYYLLFFENMIPLTKMFPHKLYLLMVLMLGLSFSLKFASISIDIRSLIDLIVGSALINASFLAFRFAIETRKLKIR